MISIFFLYSHKTAYEVRISDWSSDVCSSDLHKIPHAILLDLPSHEIGFGIAVGGDAQFRFECVTTAVAGRIGRFGAVWRQLLRSDPLKLPDPDRKSVV